MERGRLAKQGHMADAIVAASQLAPQPVNRLGWLLRQYACLVGVQRQAKRSGGICHFVVRPAHRSDSVRERALRFWASPRGEKMAWCIRETTLLQTLELFVTALEKTPGKDLVGNIGNSTPVWNIEYNICNFSSSIQNFKSSYCCLALPAATSRSVWACRH